MSPSTQDLFFFVGDEYMSPTTIASHQFARTREFTHIHRLNSTQNVFDAHVTSRAIVPVDGYVIDVPSVTTVESTVAVSVVMFFFFFVVMSRRSTHARSTAYAAS